MPVTPNITPDRMPGPVTPPPSSFGHLSLSRLSAIFAEIAALDRLAIRWTWGADFPYGGHGDTEMVVEFHPDRTGTLVVQRQRGFTDQGLREAHARAWNRCFDAMERLFAETEG